MTVSFTDNSAAVQEAFRAAAVKALEMCGLTAEGYAKLLCPVDTGALRNSIAHVVDDEGRVCYIGTNQEYAAYVELGTGTYYAGGRKTPWVYRDPKTGEFRMTNGQRAQTYLKPAVAEHGSTYRSIIEETMKNA